MGLFESLIELPEQADNIPFEDPPTSEECLRWYQLNSRSERTGNIWFPRKFDQRAPRSLFRVAECRGEEYWSARYGRLEQLSASMLQWLCKRKITSIPLAQFMLTTLDLGESQESALRMAMSEPVSVILGGPGTGKSTIAGLLANSYLDGNSKVLGLSPTGKGADRLSECIGVECYTIHRFHKLSNGSYEGIDPIRIASYDLVIVDESGMLGIDHLSMVLSRLYHSASSARIVFFGDTCQLPSVSPGKVLDDLTSSLPTSRLTVTYRFSDVDIGQACESAKSGHLHDRNTANYSLLEGDASIAMQQYARECSIYGTLETRLVTFHNSHAYYFNQECLRRGSRKRIPIVCLRNNYDYGVFNGQCGYAEDGYLWFKNQRLSPKAIYWTYSYGSTCHKAQGGQWKSVIVWIPSARFISREWLHTALSRPMEHLRVVVRDAAVTERCLAAAKSASKRVTLLAPYLKGEAQWD